MNEEVCHVGTMAELDKLRERNQQLEAQAAAYRRALSEADAMVNDDHRYTKAFGTGCPSIPVLGLLRTALAENDAGKSLLEEMERLRDWEQFYADKAYASDLRADAAEAEAAQLRSRLENCLRAGPSTPAAEHFRARAEAAEAEAAKWKYTAENGPGELRGYDLEELNESALRKLLASYEYRATQAEAEVVRLKQELQVLKSTTWSRAIGAAADAVLEPWDDSGDRPSSPPASLLRAVDRVHRLSIEPPADECTCHGKGYLGGAHYVGCPLSQGKEDAEPRPTGRNLSTPESRAYWDFIDENAKVVASWPEWKKGWRLGQVAPPAGCARCGKPPGAPEHSHAASWHDFVEPHPGDVGGGKEGA